MAAPVQAQRNPDLVIDPNIHTVLIHPKGSPLAPPIIILNSGGSLQISFDDFKANYQDYAYSIELVDSNWQSISMNEFEYINGFNQNKINNYSVSSIATQKYFHYQFNFPNNYCSPKLSGNYILKVFKNGDKTNIAFTKRFYVASSIVNINAQVQEPFDGAISRTHQRIKASIDIRDIPNFQNNQLTVKVIQNNRFNDAKTTTAPSFMRNTYLEFNNDGELVFPAGKEYRWLDLQSLQLRSDRIAEINNKEAVTKIIMRPDGTRANLLYSTFKDLNGGYLIMNTDNVQSENQNDYAQVQFTYVPKDNIPYLDQKLYLAGSITHNILDPNAEMQFDVKLGVYQKTLLLKQGYYSYSYILRDRNAPNDLDDFTETEGNHFETENNYTILVYYHAPGTLNDQLVGFATINSLF
ncbi:MAG: hypothetical protein RLZ95_702 [Bacteroidota bacterium]|jgi:hypothetical protein